MKHVIFLSLLAAFTVHCTNGSLKKPKVSQPFQSVKTLDRDDKAFDPQVLLAEDISRVHLQVHAVEVSADQKEIYVAGAFYSQYRVYRSVLLKLTQPGIWEELEPALGGQAIIWLQKTPGTDKPIAAEFLSTEGSALTGFWFPTESGWSFTSISENSRKRIRSAVGCCTEIIQDFDVKGKVWSMTLAGEEKMAQFKSSNKGLNWIPAGKPKKHQLLETGVMRDWKASPSDPLDTPEEKWIHVDLKQAGHDFTLPRYWSIKKQADKMILKPL